MRCYACNEIEMLQLLNIFFGIGFFLLRSFRQFPAFDLKVERRFQHPEF